MTEIEEEELTSSEKRAREVRVAVTLDMDVLTAAKERLRWLFREFDGKVCASGSGGKDSTVVIELAAQIAKEEGYGPLKVWFLDQETEHDTTIDYQRYLAYERDDIDFAWYQIPFRMENSTDMDDPWFNVWGEGEEWLREKEPNAITENYFGTDNFYKLLDGIRTTDYKGYITLDGMRIEESPGRRMMALSNPQYKWVTWSSNKKQPRFQPIYDWTFRDVWAAIEQHGWKYNVQYDHQYRYGVQTRHMRVSSFTHNQSLNGLLYMQESEPDLWERATKRLPSLLTFGQLKTDQYVKELPYMFVSWEEYAHYLIENLVPEEDQHIFHDQFKRLKNFFKDPEDEDNVAQAMVNSVVSGDHHGIGVNARIAYSKRDVNRK